jgi:hypothetical protein
MLPLVLVAIGVGRRISKRKLERATSDCEERKAKIKNQRSKIKAAH